MGPTEDRRLLRLALERLPGLRAADRTLLDAVLDGPRALSLLSPRSIEEILGRRLDGRLGRVEEALRAAERDRTFMESRGIRALVLADAEYPPVLRETARPPSTLYVRGSLPDPWLPALAVVGTRYPSGAGLEAAYAFGAEAAALGIPVVSGLARGIDSAAHRGAADAPGRTWAVLGCGTDSPYPARNRDLAARILDRGGGLISEYPPGTEPRPFRFPERNRIIAGLCRAVLVVEAPEGSGALISAQFALDEGRDVAVARVRGAPLGAGCRALAADGAREVGAVLELALEWNGTYTNEATEPRLAYAGKEP
ncbi:MAG: DNA-processing protein DprA [Spirochaetales bacterium]|nr:DNA-processing protein DprA [Spirochaetales bacterium]